MKKLFVTVLVATALVSGCASASKFYVKADTAVVADLSKFKAEKDTRCDADQIPASACQAVSKAFVPVWDAYLAVNKLVTSEAPIEQVDAAVADLRKAAVDLQDALKNVQGNARTILEDLLVKALSRYNR